jgi:hypothetical protein
MAGTSHKLTSTSLDRGTLTPDRTIVPMKFVEYRSLTPTVAQSYVYSQNSVFDPNVTGVGSSVTGFTTMSALYARYRVLSSKIRLCARNLDNQILGVAISASLDNPGAGIGAAQLSAYRYAKPDIIKLISPGAPTAELRDAINTSEIAGTALYAADSFYGIGAADPAAQFYWVLAVDVLSTGGAVGIYYTVEIEYLTEWSEPRSAPV